jgi:hypothetical protein
VPDRESAPERGVAIPRLCIREAVMGAAILLLVVAPSAICLADPPAATKIPITLPGGFVVILGGPLPKSDAATVPAEKYRELQERVDRLQAIIHAAQPIRPRACELDGRVEQRGRQAVVRIKATFKVTTNRPDAIVYLGCQRTHAVEARTEDGKAPLLVAADDGLRVQFPTSGEHTLRLELDCPLMPRGVKGSELGFEIGLPGAAITTLTLEPPANVKQYTLTTRAPKGQAVVGAAEVDVEQAEVDRFLAAKGGAPLGAIGSLVVSWEDPTRKAEAVRSVDGEVKVNIGSDDLITEARLRLRGPASEWRFTAPATADVTVGPWVNPSGGKTPAEPAPGRVPNVVRPEPGQTVWRVEVREPATTDLLVTINTRTPRGRDAAGRGPFPVGPFVVLDVSQQAGVIRIRAPLAVIVNATTHGDSRRESDDPGGQIVYRYRYSPLKSPPAEAPVVLSLSAATGVIHCRTRATLRAAETGWRLREEVSLAPSRTEIEEVAVELPEGFKLTDVEPREIVESFTADGAKAAKSRITRLQLTGPRRTSFTITLHGDYVGGPPGATVSLIQPRILGVVGRGSDVLVESPGGRDVRGTLRVWENAQVGNSETTLELDGLDGGRRLHGAADGLAARVDLQFEPAAAGARSTIEADVVIGPQRVLVTEKLAFRFLGRLPGRVRLRSGSAVRDLRTSRGVLERVGEAWDLVVPTDGDREPEFHLTYAVAPPKLGEEFSIPLLEPEPIASARLVRVWMSASLTVELREPTDWQPAPVEVIAGRSTLPDLVLRSSGAVIGPAVTISARNASAEEGPTITKVHAEVRLGDAIEYRVRLIVQNCAAGGEIVVPAGAHNLEVQIQGKRLPEAALVRGDQTTVRVPPLLVDHDGVAIELRYRIPGSSTSRLELPQLTGSELAGEVIWTIVPGPGKLVLASGDVPNSWNWRSWLDAFGLSSSRGNVTSEAAVVVRQSQLNGIHIVQVPRLLWVLIWSAVAAVCFLAWRFAGRAVRYSAFTLVMLAAIIAAFGCPQPLALALVAMLPGVVGLTLLVVGYRVLHVRYRRRIQRFPAFARTGSSLVRPSIARVNEPSKNGSSASSAGKTTPSARAESP